MTSLWMMFSGAFLAATLLPGGSEVLLVAFLNDAPSTWWQLLLMATLGNTLGAMTSYGLGRAGRLAKNPQDIQSKSHQTALKWIERYGMWALLLSWLPLIGDVLCLLAGWLKWPLVASTLLIFVGKILRYSVIVFIFMSV
ncbi:DedA family protein [Shewanella inventionis]|uniref:Membrane protein n=1 Tax=Shewanella inventionis TaxID=1738770 RepID=A0ABQ1IZ62_9GAMM|nr:YqaA family protein [Shewanella inventionis]MCL1157264.1 DedA family protein [Shewanella inventionis]UAL44831.1 DedA family protein [Shewanella inventionis]GGB56121.1 membrane protein [Shewanella inventionis]